MDKDSAIGIDLGLGTGAASLYHRKPLRFEVLSLWKKRRVKGQTYGQIIARLEEEVFSKVIPHAKDRLVVIDYTPHEIFMRTGKSIIVQKSFIVGYLFKIIIDAGGFPVSMSSSFIRGQLNLKRKVSKEEVHDRLKEEVLPLAYHNKRLSPDLVDSLILAHTGLNALDELPRPPKRKMHMLL